MAWLNGVLITYAILLVAGGIFGYAKAGSAVSLIASGAAAIVVLFGIWYAGTNRSVGYAFCFAAAVALGVFFAIRAAGGSTMPGIPGLAMSVIVAACLTYAHFTAK